MLDTILTLHIFFIFSLLYVYYVPNMIKKLELILLKIKFGYVQISVPKFGIPILKTTYTNCSSRNFEHFLIFLRLFL